jgi:hypothetical protein
LGTGNHVSPRFTAGTEVPRARPVGPPERFGDGLGVVDGERVGSADRCTRDETSTKTHLFISG